jgi:hypothetical protein
MPQDNSRNETRRTGSESNRSESARAERRSEQSTMASAASQPFGEIGTRNVAAALRLQQEMLDVLTDIGREWFARATSEAVWAFKLPNKLTAARSVPDALSAYQEWLGEGMNMFGEDSRRFMSDSRKIVDTGVRCFADTTPAAMT